MYRREGEGRPRGDLRQRGPNYYLLIFTKRGDDGVCSPRRDRMLNNMGTFYKRPRAAFYRPRPELEKCLCGSASTPPRNNVFQKYRRFHFLLAREVKRDGGGGRPRARKKRDRGKKGRRDAKPDPKPFVDPPVLRAVLSRRDAPCSDREESLNRSRSPIRDRALMIFTRRIFREYPIGGVRATQNVPEKAPSAAATASSRLEIRKNSLSSEWR